MANVTGAVYEFGTFRLDTARRLLTRDGEHLTMPPKTFDLLLLLVESRGRVFAKKELMAALWPDTFVEDANLSFQVSALRKALGGEGIEWIETLPRYGYRFAGEVLEVSPNGPPEPPVWIPPEPVSAPPPPVASVIFRDRIPSYYWLATALITIVAASLTLAYFRATPREERAVSFLIIPPDLVSTPDADSIAVSPDGNRIVFIGVGADGAKQLWMRSLGSLTADVIPGTELVNGAFWSPDGRSVAFFASGKLKKVDVQSGAAQAICDTPDARSAGTWGPNDTILFETTERPEIYTVAASGGVPKAVTRLNSSNHEVHHSAPQFLPDGRHFIYFVQSERPENSGIYVGSLDSRDGQRLTNSNGNAAYTRVRGAYYLLFPRDTNLMGQAFDVSTRELTGTPFVVASRLLIGLGGGHPRAALSVSQDGVLAYRTRVDTGSTDLQWFDRSGKRLASVGESEEYSNPALSPDQKKLIVSRMDAQIRTRDLWLYDFANGGFSRFTFGTADETNAVWSADGTRIAFDAFHDGVVDIYEKEIASGSEPKLLLHTNENKYIYAWSPDGSVLLFKMGTATWGLPRGGGKLLGPYAMDTPRISPNGKWVAYASYQSGRSEVYVQSFPPAEGKWQISTMGGMEPAWREDGEELYYVNSDNLYAMAVKTDSEVFQPGAVKQLFPIRLERTERRARYQVADNGRRFLVNVPRESSSRIIISTNWLPKPVR
ncbi:MAG: winged helix-turn-helix domain-containing protein [Acidobacteriota bacterium]